MNTMKTENGYALVTVLLIIVIFMVISLSFMGQAFSSVKQNKVVETSSQSVAVAEMGVTYYKVATQDLFEKNRQLVNDKVNSTVVLSPNDTFYSDTAKDEAVRATADIIELGLINLPADEKEVYVDGDPDIYFSISNIDTIPDIDSDNVKVSYTVIGVDEGKETQLDADISINLSSIVFDEALINFVLPAFDEVPKPAAGCINFDNGCNELLVDGSVPLPGKTDNNGNNNGLSDKIVYSTGSYTVNGNANKAYNLKVHTEGDLTVTGNISTANKLTLESKGNASFDGQLKITSSRLLIKGNLLNSKHLFLDEDPIANDGRIQGSFAYIGGNAQLDSLEISSNSTLCVKGTLTVSGQKRIDGNLIVEDPNDTTGKFEAMCGSPTSKNLTINWGETIGTKVDNVMYFK